MRKRINLILVICLVAVVACTLFACNKDGSEYVDKVPQELGLNIDPITGEESTEINGGSAVIQYSFTKEVSSLLHSIIIDPEDGFNIETVKYSIVYRKGAQSTVTTEKPLKLEYVDEADRPLLKQAGFHTIHTSVPYGGGVVRGSFTMRLKYEYEEVEYMNLTFNLNGGIPHFATATNDVAKTTVEKGSTFAYDEFIRAFTITKAGQAVQYFSVKGNSVTTLSRTASASESGTSSKITITGDTTFTVKWTDNTVKVTFDINAPTTSTTGTVPKIPAQDVEQSVGTVQRPSIDSKLFNGYLFAGWYDKSNNAAWNFTTPAGQKDISLYAKWTIRYYETTIYPMSSTFKSDIKNSVSAKGSKTELKSIDDAKAAGYIIAGCDVTFNASTNNVLSVDITGLTYGKQYSEYAAEVRVKNTNNDADKRIIVLSELFTAFEKLTSDEELNKHIVTGGVMYTSQACKDEDKVEVSGDILGNKILYIKWSLDLDGLTAEKKNEILSSYYTNILYKDSYEIKPDGTVKLVDIQDETFCEIIVPDSITIDGTDRYISEFASKAAMNVRSLGKLDLSQAAHLTAIGSEAFINCSNLYEIVWPEDNNIESIGRKSFKNTDFENNYPTDFIVINDILYKFLDKEGNAREVDMTACDEKDELTVVKKIADNAFADAMLLEKVTLSENVEEIGDNAFLNLEILKKVTAGDKLYKVSASAFAGTALINDTEPTFEESESVDNTVYLKDAMSNNVPAVKVGKVLVKVLDEYITTLQITAADGITSFADEALSLCKNLESLNIAAYQNIAYIGSNAISAAVPFLQTQADGFLIINGILSDYFNKDYNFYDAVIPASVKTISSYAFNSYARYLKTIEIGANVEKIDEYAFAGATALKSLLFSKVTADGSGFNNLPEINPRSFTTSDGTLIKGLNFYFYKSAMDRFKYLETYSGELTETEEAWMSLYMQNKANFHVEKIEKVYVNAKEVKDVYVLPAGAYIWQQTARGIILESNAGVVKYETLTSSMLDPFNYNEEGIHTVNIRENSDWGLVSEGTEYIPFEYQVIFQVAGNPQFYTVKEKNIIDGNGLLATGNYYIEGFDGDIKGAAIPTFYTTKSAVDLEEIQFCYKTVQSGSMIHKIQAIECSGFAPNASRLETAYFTFDFHGAGIYRVSVQYMGTEPKINSIEQAGPISVPLNADVRAAIGEAGFVFSSEDGIEEVLTADMNEFEVISVNGNTDNLSLVSNTLGLNTVVLRYRGNRKAIDTLKEVTVVYSVVLEGDPAQFTFEIKKGKAIITSHSKKDIETLVIPSSYIKDGTEYPVTEIASSVFANYKNLVTVYLPSTIEMIRDSAFSGCTLLEKVYSSESTENIKTPIGDEDFDIITSNAVRVGHVNVTAYDATTGTMVIPDVFTYQDADRNMGSYTETATISAIPTLTATIFDTFFNGTVYLDYTAENYDFIKREVLDARKNTINGISVVFMFESAELVSSVDKGDDGVAFLLFNDTNVAFVADEVKNTGDADLEENYLFYYVISETQPRKISTAQRHFTYDEASFVEEERYVERTRRLKSLDTVAEGTKAIIVGDEYASEEISSGVYVYIVSTTTATADELTYSEDNFMVYLPDTIFNDCVIKNKSGENVETIVYKHGEELLYSTNEYIPSTLTFIGSSAFSGCVSLKEIDFTKATKLNYIGANAFADSGIEYLDLSNTIIEEINGSTFQGCKSLTNVIIPTTVKFVGAYAFDSCTSLILDKEFFRHVEAIGASAFAVCTSFTSIDLTETAATTIGSQAFSVDGATVTVAFAAGHKPAGWEADWYGICDVEYAG